MKRAALNAIGGIATTVFWLLFLLTWSAGT